MAMTRFSQPREVARQEHVLLPKNMPMEFLSKPSDIADTARKEGEAAVPATIVGAPFQDMKMETESMQCS